ncbi:MAG: hypothetical protein CMN21_23575 [Rubinisphaera sp.]|nr:hypothetical protein [Rubinisphaera sp.]|tara:strand:+ start:620 stop:823 length:204 start_codon:yes stop_codon:yes gene_type:complete
MDGPTAWTQETILHQPGKFSLDSLPAYSLSEPLRFEIAKAILQTAILSAVDEHILTDVSFYQDLRPP